MTVVRGRIVATALAAAFVVLAAGAGRRPGRTADPVGRP